MKKILNNLKTFFVYDWWKLGLLLLVTIFASCYTSKLKTSLKDREIIHLLVSGESKADSFCKNYYEKFQKEEGILEIELSQMKTSDSRFSSIFQSTFGIDCDILLLPESYLLDNNTFLAQCYRFTNQEISSLPGIETKMYSNSPVGLKIYDEQDDSYGQSFFVNNYFSFTETTYLFIDASSTNLEYTNSLNQTTAFSAAYYLL